MIRKEEANCSLQVPEQQLKETSVTPTPTLYLSRSEVSGSKGILYMKLTSAHIFLAKARSSYPLCHKTPSNPVNSLPDTQRSLF